MFAGIENARVKKVNEAKNGRKYVTFGDLDDISEVEISTDVCGVSEGFEGKVVFDGYSDGTYNGRVTRRCLAIRPVESEKASKPEKK